MTENKSRRAWNATAYNGRFGVMAAGSPQKRQCGFESLYPAGKVVEAATTPSRWDVVCNGGGSAAARPETNDTNQRR